MSGWRIALWVALVLAALGFLYLVRSILLPFLVAIIIASLLEPAVRKLRLRGFPRPLAVVSVLLPFYALFIVGLALLIPRLIGEVQSLSASVDSFTNNMIAAGDRNNYFVRWNPVIELEQSQGFESRVDHVLGENRGFLSKVGLPTSSHQFITEYVEPRRPQITASVRGAFNSVFGIVTGLVSNLLDLVLLLVLIPLLMLEWEDFKRTAPRMIPPAFRTGAVALLDDVGRVFISYLRGFAILLFVFAATAALVLGALNVPNALLLGGLFAALFPIPIFGHLIAIVIIFLVIGLGGVNGNLLIHFPSSWTYAVVAVLLYFGYTVVIDNFVFPKLVGKAVGLSAPLSLFVSLSGLALFGVVGMVVALPVAGAAKVIFDRVIRFTSATPESLALPAIPLRHRRAT
jgi:predicted PurR-regulated permease PerM